MRIGINGTGLVQKASIEAIREDACAVALDGFASYWLAEHPTGGFVALTAQTATGGRLCLGIGLSHEVMMAQLGIGFDKSIRHLREFLSILMPLLEEGKVSFKGETLSCEAQLFKVPDRPPAVVVAALGPQALRVAGSRTRGTTLAWVGPKTIAGHIVPAIAEAASRAGRPPPRIIATLPVVVTTQADVIRERIGKTLTMYGELPSYRAMFEREGVDGPADLAIVGNSAEVEDSLMALKDAGVTDFAASVYATNADEHRDARELLVRLLPADKQENA